MNKRRLLAVMLMFSLCSVASLGRGAATEWFAFNKKFVQANYASDSALGKLTATAWHPARQVHTISCGGNDGELHIGILVGDIDTAAANQPATAPIQDSDPDWGLVAELPNAGDGDGPGTLDEVTSGQVTFTGYYRLWNEGHAVGSAAPSNPHHVLEVHPAWAFSGASVNFSRPDLVDTIPGYAGYGATQFKPLLSSLGAGNWLHAFQDDQLVHVELVKASNFFQLPVTVNQITSIQGGHELKVDVFSDKSFKHLVFEGLRCITATDSPIDSDLSEGDQAFLLGLFSVNLRKAMEGSTGAGTQDDAVVVADALEFFVFGRASKSAVATCSRK